MHLSSASTDTASPPTLLKLCASAAFSSAHKRPSRETAAHCRANTVANGAPESESPAHAPHWWHVNGSAPLRIERLANKSGGRKIGFVAAPRVAARPLLGKANLLVKSWVRPEFASAVFTEVLYLERLRGLPGVPRLHGGWWSGDDCLASPASTTEKVPGLCTSGGAGSRFFYAVQLAGTPVGSGKGTVNSTSGPSQHGLRAERYRYADNFMELARAQPYGLARALLRLFRTFAQVGGYFSDDLNLKQFTFTFEAEAADGAPAVYLIDAPSALTPAALRASCPALKEDERGALRPLGHDSLAKWARDRNESLHGRAAWVWSCEKYGVAYQPAAHTEHDAGLTQLVRAL
jgi:hypothetical protein